MSLSTVHIPTDVNRLVSTLDITDCAFELAQHLAPLFIDGHMAQVMRHPVTYAALFRSDQRYFLDDEHGASPVNPFSMTASGNSAIVNEEGKVIMTAQDYWRNVGFFEISQELSSRMMHAVAQMVQETLNSYQQWNTAMDYEYMINHSDDIMLARMAGREVDYVNAMNNAGHHVDTRGLYQTNLFGDSRGSSAAYTFGGISAEDLVRRIQASKKGGAVPTMPMSDDSQWARINASKKPNLVITDDDAEQDRLASSPELAEPVDTAGMRGVLVKGEMTRSQYNHHVSSYGDSSTKILNAYVINQELKYALEEIVHKCQRVIVRNFASLSALIERSDSPGFGWDVYQCRPGGKNTIEIHHVHDLRIHEWELIRKNGYDAVKNQLVGTKTK